MAELVYNAPPTCGEFMASSASIRAILGPVGSGKTTACIFELLRRACEQDPDPISGKRLTRFAIIRQTLKQLKDTVLKDILFWFKDIADYRVSESTVYLRFGDVVSEWILLPMEDPEDVRRLLSSQLTGAWMSEGIEMSADIIDGVYGRCGRYPAPFATWKGLIIDTNFPTENSEWHKLFESPPPNMQVFKQPGGLEEGAENLAWLRQTKETLTLPEDDPVRQEQGRTYYRELAQGRNQDWIQRYVHARYGNDPSGTAVFKASFNKDVHLGTGLEPLHGRLLIIGQDFGRDPWSVIMQMDMKGRLMVLEEVLAEDIGLEQHIKTSLRPVLYGGRYIGSPIAIIGDPSGISKDSLFETNAFELIKSLGLMAFPAPTNDLEPRLGAVEHFLISKNIIVDKDRCPTIARALAGEYRFEKTKAGKRKPKPDKNDASHPMDALQYGCLAYHGGMTSFIQGRVLRHNRKPPARARVSASAWT